MTRKRWLFVIAYYLIYLLVLSRVALGMIQHRWGYLPYVVIALILSLPLFFAIFRRPGR